jgi:26S proteasome regulatory subunit N6
MKAIATALQHRSLLEFEQTLAKFKAQLTDDPIIRLHLSALYDTLLEQNLIRVIEPFSRVEVTHVAELVKLPLQQVEQKYPNFQFLLERLKYAIQMRLSIVTLHN